MVLSILIFITLPQAFNLLVLIFKIKKLIFIYKNLMHSNKQKYTFIYSHRTEIF